MRYEMIFGDEKLFDRVNRDDVVIVCESKHDNRHFYAVEDAIEYLRNKKDFTPEVAMRRIIKEPKRWTWEDKKAGVLPEVGAQCKDRSFLFKVINVTDKYVVIETMHRITSYNVCYTKLLRNITTLHCFNNNIFVCNVYHFE